MTNVALPFLTLPGDSVRLDWLIGPCGQPLSAVTDFLHDWDYAQDLEVEVRIETDMAKSALLLRMQQEGLRLRAVLYIGTGPGSMARSISMLDSACLSNETKLGGRVAGGELSGRIRLDVQILLDKVGKSLSPLAPARRGSRLWSAHRDIMLEDGGESRFPIELASFSKMEGEGFARSALWHVSWRWDDLDADFGGSVRVYVNSDNATFVERFIAGDPTTLQAILGDVMAQMISVALEMPDVGELDVYEDGSLGRQVRLWIDLAFPGRSLGMIRSQRKARPGTFMSIILACAEMGNPE